MRIGNFVNYAKLRIIRIDNSILRIYYKATVKTRLHERGETMNSIVAQCLGGFAGIAVGVLILIVLFGRK